MHGMRTCSGFGEDGMRKLTEELRNVKAGAGPLRFLLLKLGRRGRGDTEEHIKSHRLEPVMVVVLLCVFVGLVGFAFVALNRH